MTDLDTAPLALVEDDDVVFSIGLCREINRLYGLYERYQLAQSEHICGGLGLAAELIEALRDSVADGMPAFRLAVASAQVREMLAIMFGIDRLVGSVRASSLAAIEAPSAPTLVPAVVSAQVHRPLRLRMRWSWRLGRLVTPHSR